MAQLTINAANCKECGYCVNACPKNALSIGEKFNTKGYRYVCVDEDKCIACGICYSVCPDYVLSIPAQEQAG